MTQPPKAKNDTKLILVVIVAVVVAVATWYLTEAVNRGM